MNFYVQFFVHMNLSFVKLAIQLCCQVAITQVAVITLFDQIFRSCSQLLAHPLSQHVALLSSEMVSSLIEHIIGNIANVKCGVI